MPTFQGQCDRGRSTPPSRPIFTFPGPIYRELKRKPSEERIRTNLCEGPLLDCSADAAPTPEDEAGTSTGAGSRGICDRIELMERLKRGESPVWAPRQHLKSIVADYGTKEGLWETRCSARGTIPVLPPAEITATPPPVAIIDIDLLQAGLSIERPRSALHTGDFTEERPEGQKDFSLQPGINDNGPVYNPPSPWLCTSPPRGYTPFQHDPRVASNCRPSLGIIARSRAPSLSSSYSSSFVYKPPTSPLVNSQSNDDLDFSPVMEHIDIEADYLRNQRRHTFQPYTSTATIPSSAFSGEQVPVQRRDAAYPYQAHQPRRSITLNPSSPQTTSSPSTPAFSRSRRPSFASDSPLHHASMVGSYEESILRGRMSTAPSRPLDFVAQIGVLGLGKCKPGLKCPSHVTLSFPAVFYSYATTTHGRNARSEDGPSPYVGQIDLENGLPAVEHEDGHAKRKRQSKQRTRIIDGAETSEGQNQSIEKEIRRAHKQKRRSTSPKAPPGGCYRIPEKGQLQIIIKNPNKTAVKLFLVPYDLDGMEPGTKTFIRQRCYSAGPIIDLPGTASQAQGASKERSTLRYLINLNICCPSRGRYFLYKNIRVVFANRVPDGKEKLQNEIQFPDPRFTVYKPGRDSVGPGTALSPTSDKAFRRRSSGFPLEGSQQPFESMDCIAQSLHTQVSGVSPYPYANNFSTTPVEPIPFSLYRRGAPSSDLEGNRPGKASESQIDQDSGMSSSWNTSSSVSGTYDKLHRGDVGYGGNAFSNAHNGHQVAGEGLLAQKLKCLGVGKLCQTPPSHGL